MRYLERYSQRQSAAMGKHLVLKVDDAGVVAPPVRGGRVEGGCCVGGAIGVVVWVVAVIVFGGVDVVLLPLFSGVEVVELLLVVV